DKCGFAPLAPELGVLAAKIQYRQFALWIEFAEIAPLALAAAVGFGLRSMERRIAQGDVETVLWLQQSFEDMPWLVLLAQGNALGQFVGRDDGTRRGQRHGVDIGAGEMPTVFAQPDQWINAIGTGANVQGADRSATRDLMIVMCCQKVGQPMQIVGPTGNRRAQVTGWNVPMGDAIELFQQRTVENPHGLRVGEIDTLIAVWIADDEGRQFRASRNQQGKVITSGMAVARMQRGLVLGRLEIVRFGGWRFAGWHGRALKLGQRALSHRFQSRRGTRSIHSRPQSSAPAPSQKALCSVPPMLNQTLASQGPASCVRP